MAMFISVRLGDEENTPVFINAEKANYIVFNEQTGMANFWFGDNDVYVVPATKEQVENVLLGADIPVREP